MGEKVVCKEEEEGEKGEGEEEKEGKEEEEGEGKEELRTVAATCPPSRPNKSRKSCNAQSTEESRKLKVVNDV
jgi:hypothetical protein